MERKLSTLDTVKVADAAAGTSIAGFAVSYATASEAVTLVAGVVAIAAGLAAVWVHVEKAMQIRRQRLRRKAGK